MDKITPLPTRLLSLDQQGQGRAVKAMGRGRLLQRFLDVYGFRDGLTGEMWIETAWARNLAPCHGESGNAH